MRKEIIVIEAHFNTARLGALIANAETDLYWSSKDSFEK